MLYQIIFHWSSKRYRDDFRSKSQTVESKFQRIRKKHPKCAGGLPLLWKWTFGIEDEELDEYEVAARFVSLLSKAEIERRVELELVPGFADKVEIKAMPGFMEGFVGLN